MTGNEAIQLVKRLKEFCGERNCKDDCPFADRQVLSGACLLKNKIPCDYGVREFEYNLVQIDKK